MEKWMRASRTATKAALIVQVPLVLVGLWMALRPGEAGDRFVGLVLAIGGGAMALLAWAHLRMQEKDE